MSEQAVQDYLGKLDRLERKMLNAALPSGDTMLERGTIENYRQQLRHFGSYDPAMQEMLMEELDRDISRINARYRF